jgi:hypothetical protein
MLRRLQTTARLMQTTAHPDDEDGGMLTLEARGKGVSTLLMTLTRGEGGQNKLGSNLFDVLSASRAWLILDTRKSPKKLFKSGKGTMSPCPTWCGSFGPFVRMCS